MTDSTNFESIRIVFSEYLIKNQLRKTPERFAILEHINDIKGHFTAEMLYKVMQPNFRVSLASVYNNLDLLLKSGLITKHQFGCNKSEYERTFQTNAHHHIVCIHCGKIKEFSDKNLKENIESKKFKNFLPTHFNLNIYGLCNKCKHL
jgi:Fur family ferric uptake transcriptional regulator